MNPYPRRIGELHRYLHDTFGMQDTAACDILLACLLDTRSTGAQKPWIVVETDWMSRDCREAWFDFGGMAGAQSLASARIERASPAEAMVNTWLASRKAGCAGIYVEAEWRRLARLSHGRGVLQASPLNSAYAMLMSGCVRLRTEYPKTAWATMETDRRTADLRELKRLTMQVLDSQYREKVPGAGAAAPGAMLYWCELLQKISLTSRDWNTLIWSLAQVVRNACTLYNDPSRQPDWSIAERLIRDSVNWATGQIVRKAHGREDLKPFDEYAAPHKFGLQRVWVDEVTRLCRAGVLQYRGSSKKDRRKWNRLNGGDWYTLVAPEAGRMFAS